MEEEDGGYDADFVDNLDKDLECPVCMLALREPVLTHCGHHFCHSCTMKLMKFGKFDCPLDSQTCKEGDIFRDRKVERKVLSLMVYCSRRALGCSWKGELRNLQGHSGENGDCSFVELACSFAPIGCPVKLKRHDFDKHINNDQAMHLDLMMKRVVSQDRVIGDYRRQIDSLKQTVHRQDRHIASLKQMVKRSTAMTTPFQWRIENWLEKMQDAKKGGQRDFYSEPFYTSHPGYKLCLNIYPNGWGSEEGSNVGLALRLMRGEYDEELLWPFSFKYSLSLHGEEKSYTKEIDPASVSSPEAFQKPLSKMNVGHGWSGFISHVDLRAGGYVGQNRVLNVEAKVHV